MSCQGASTKIEVHSSDSDSGSDSESQCFSLFPASIGKLVSIINDDGIIIQTVGKLRDDYALGRLQNLCEQKTKHDTFILRHTCDFPSSVHLDENDMWHHLLELSETVASAIIDTLEKTKTQWKQIQLSNCHVNEPLLHVLGAAKHMGIFRSLEFQNFDHGFYTTYPLLSYFALHNPTLTQLKFRGDELDESCLVLLKTILETTKIECTLEASNAMVDRPTTRLQSLKIRNEDYRLNKSALELLSPGLRHNDTLIEFSLVNAHIPSLLLESLRGHLSLQTLNLSRGRFSESMIMTLGQVLQEPTCHIQSLSLNNCEILTASQFFGPLRIEVLSRALAQGKCITIIKLSLKENCASSRDLQKLMQTIHRHCPNLRELDFSQNRVERIIWNQNDIGRQETQTQQPSQLEIKSRSDFSSPEQNNTHPKKTLKNTSIQCLWLSRNPILHNRFRARSDSDTAKLEQLLRDFSALGKIAAIEPRNSRFVPFSSKVDALLAFNYVTRGRLIDGKLPLSLWSRVLDRVSRLSEHDEDMDLTKKTALGPDNKYIPAMICQASVLFLLFKHHPSHVTREACQTMYQETNDVMACATISTNARTRSRNKSQIKRRKLG